MTIRFTILGALASMKNRRIPSRHNPRVTLPNRACRVFERDFLVQVPRSACKAIGSLTKPLRSTITVYYRDMRSDLDAAFVYDLLQKAGVIRNDRYIREKHEVARIDKACPRVEIQIEELEA